MTIQGGGKFNSNASRGQDVERPRRAAEKRQAREATEAGDTPKTTRTKDTFEAGNFGGPRPAHTPPHGTAGLASQAFKLDEVLNSPSQIKAMAEAITAHAKRLSGDFDLLKTEAQDVVNGLAQQGFSPDAVAQARPDLADLRKQMSQLRGRIAADGRRLKLLKVAANRMGETKLSEKVSTQLKRIADMERGWGRAFLALGIAGTLSAAADGDGQVGHRVALAQSGNVDRNALGNYLGQVAPGTAASQLLVALLEEGPHAPPGRLIAEAYAELHADVLAGRMGRALQGLGLWRQAMG